MALGGVTKLPGRLQSGAGGPASWPLQPQLSPATWQAGAVCVHTCALAPRDADPDRRSRLHGGARLNSQQSHHGNHEREWGRRPHPSEGVEGGVRACVQSNVSLEGDPGEERGRECFP